MAKLIIDYPDDMTAGDALEFIQEVVLSGKVSYANGIRHFCWLTTFKTPAVKEGGVTAITRVKKKGQKSDSLIVRRGV